MATDATSEHVGNLAAAAFASVEQAEAAIQRLVGDGFPENQIEVIGSNDHQHLLEEWIPETEESTGEASASHVAVGGLFGGLLGGVAALAIPGVGWMIGAGIIATTIAAGSFGGGFIGPLLHLGVEKDRAVYLDERLQAGDLIVTVHDEERTDEAQEILQEHGGKTANT
ncbi:hypothetical protein BH23CHL2_BH23CHL2_01170 [soil metagenome]